MRDGATLCDSDNQWRTLQCNHALLDPMVTEGTAQRFEIAAVAWLGRWFDAQGTSAFGLDGLPNVYLVIQSYSRRILSSW